MERGRLAAEAVVAAVVFAVMAVCAGKDDREWHEAPQRPIQTGHQDAPSLRPGILR